MTAERGRLRFGEKPHRRLALACAISCALFAAGARPGSANDADNQQIKSSARFSLQCNATVGTIENVELASVVPGQNGQVTVRGTYHQKVGSFGRFGFQGPEAAGGVFEGIYLRDRGVFKELQFKISIRSGSVPPNCLR
jgi:hypothetical protein